MNHASAIKPFQHNHKQTVSLAENRAGNFDLTVKLKFSHSKPEKEMEAIDSESQELSLAITPLVTATQSAWEPTMATKSCNFLPFVNTTER